MSYILDALRRAETERQRGAVPGLHAQATLVAATEAAPRLKRVGVAAALAALLVAAAALAWWFGRHSAPAMPDASPPAPAIARPPPPANAPTVAAAPMPAQPAPVMAAPAPTMPTPPAPPAPVPPQVIVMVNPPAAAVLPMRSASVAAVAAAPPAAAASVPAAVPRLAELPDAVRATLPPIALGGIVHASTPAQRLVILGGQVFHEGDRPLPELLVQEIRPRTVVLVWRGQAFEFGP